MNLFIKKLKSLLPELKDTGTKDVEQPGSYLYFESLTPLSRNMDMATFQIILVGDSLSEGAGSIINLVESVRKRLRGSENEFSGKDIFKGVTEVKSAKALFTYAINIEIEQYREVEHVEIL